MGKRNDNTSSDEDKEQYVVERVVGKRVCRGKTYYRIKWLGYPEDQNTWEPLKNCTGALSLIREFEENHEQTNQLPLRSKSLNDAGKRKSKTVENQKTTTNCRKTEVYDTSKRLADLVIDLDDLIGCKIVPEQHAVVHGGCKETSDMNYDYNYDERSEKVTASKTTISRLSKHSVCDEKIRSSFDQDNENVPIPDMHRDDTCSNFDTISSCQIGSMVDNDTIVPSITAASNSESEEELKLRLSKCCDNDIEIVGLEPVKDEVAIGIRIKDDKNVICRFNSREVTRLWPQLYVSFLESHIVFE